MPLALIHPSYTDPVAKQNWAETLDQEVDFTTPERLSTLTAAEANALNRLHPTGKARFWGAVGSHDASMARLATGDVVLFTGETLVRAVGEVGCTFRNPRFADTLWAPHEDKGSYRNVYSLVRFQRTDIPYQEVHDLPGLSAKNLFRRLKILEGESYQTLVEGLRIDTAAAEVEAWRLEADVGASGRAQRIDVEAVNSSWTGYERSGGRVLVHRAEASLLDLFKASLDPGIEVCRTRSAAGVTDLYLVHNGSAEIVEAKRGSGRIFVRQALAQLLDYAVDCPDPLARLTALFPARPDDAGLSLLHRYGCDCVFLDDRGGFERLAAPRDAFDHMSQRWR